MTSRQPEETSDTGAIPPLPIHFSADSEQSNAVKRLQATIRGQQSSLGPGDQLGDYLLGPLLGSGAMGTVYEAEHRETNERVAVKVLNSSFSRQQDALERFQKEARILEKCDSEHITRLLAVDNDGEHYFLVTELVRGTTVERLISEEGRLSETTAIDIAIQTAKALADLTAIDVLHRDVKPGNILLASNESAIGTFDVRLTDFGLARGLTQTGSMDITRTNSLLGTPFYMSPEQFSDAKHVDCRSDIYSLGATLFHMLAGQPPFPTTEILELAELHRHAPPPDVRSLNSSVSDAVGEIINRCLQKRMDLRYSTPDDLIADLRRLQSGTPIQIASHPQIPGCDPNQLLEFRFEWELNSSAAELWPFVSNTERLNKAMGLPAIAYRTEVDSHGQAEVYAHVKMMGIPMKWREHVYEWVEERRMGILREFDSGPLKWFTSVVEFLPTVNGRTRLIHSLKIRPNGWLGRRFASLKMGRATQKTLTRIYQRIDAVLQSTRAADPTIDPFEAGHAQTRRQSREHQRIFDQLRTRELSPDALIQVSDFVTAGPAQELGRIRPLVLATRLNLPADEVLAVLMEGTAAGLFELAWDVICPSCRVPSQTYSLLRMVQDHEHCEACQLNYEVDFAKSVETIFKAHPVIRTVDTGKYCIGGPAHSPHVAAQIRLAPGETAELGLALENGTFRIQSPQLAKAMTFKVEHPRTQQQSKSNGEFETAKQTLTTERTKTDSHRSIKLRLGVDADWIQDLKIAGQQQLMTVVNSFDREVTVKVERTAPDRQALTAADAMALPSFRKIFPAERFSPHQLGNLTSLSILRTIVRPSGESDSAIRSVEIQEHLQRLHELSNELNGIWLKTTDNGAVIAFTQTESAANLIIRLSESLPDNSRMSLAATLCNGAVTASLIGGRIDYFGEPVDRLAVLATQVDNGQCLADQSFAKHFYTHNRKTDAAENSSIPDVIQVMIPVAE